MPNRGQCFTWDVYRRAIAKLWPLSVKLATWAGAAMILSRQYKPQRIRHGALNGGEMGGGTAQASVVYQTRDTAARYTETFTVGLSSL